MRCDVAAIAHTTIDGNASLPRCFVHFVSERCVGRCTFVPARAQRYHAKSLRALATKFSAATQDPESGAELTALLQRCGCFAALDKAVVKEAGHSHGVKPVAKL